MIKRVCKLFSNVVVVVNANGMVDLNWTEKYSTIKGILFIGVHGEQGVVALASILMGKITPSGKMSH